MIEYRKILNKDIPKIATLHIKFTQYIKRETKDPHFEINDLSEQATISSLEKYIQDKQSKYLWQLKTIWRVPGAVASNKLAPKSLK